MVVSGAGGRVAAALAAGAVALALAGCGAGAAGPNPARVAVAGRVLLDGQPAPAGLIEFVPLTPSQMQAQGLVADDGTFAIGREAGPSAGEYRVEIRCSKKTGRRVRTLGAADGTGMADERVPVVPAQYNTNTTLRQTVTSDANDLVFDLRSRP